MRSPAGALFRDQHLSATEAANLPLHSRGCYHKTCSHEVPLLLLAARLSLPWREFPLVRSDGRITLSTFSLLPSRENTGTDCREVRMPVLTLTENSISSTRATRR